MSSGKSAVDREVEWFLQDVPTLPPLLAAQQGAWEVVQGYVSRTPQTRKTALYVVRVGFVDQRFANQRTIRSHELRVKAYWPIGSSTTGRDLWEVEQRAFDKAVDDVVARVRGLLMDHTHGGRFLSAAEAPDPGRIAVRFYDPEQAAAVTPQILRAEITYSVDDPDVTG